VDRTSEKVEKNGEKISVKNKVAKRVNWEYYVVCRSEELIVGWY
jgi:hypothetical protein